MYKTMIFYRVFNSNRSKSVFKKNRFLSCIWNVLTKIIYIIVSKIYLSLLCHGKLVCFMGILVFFKNIFDNLNVVDIIFIFLRCLVTVKGRRFYAYPMI